jgi:TonB family protein
MKFYISIIALFISAAVSATPFILEVKIDTTWVKWKGEVVNGRRHGLWIGTREDRTFEQEYVNGVLNGNFKVTRVSGEVYRTGYYSNGLRDGVWMIYSNSDTSILTTYAKGKMQGKYMRFQSNGAPMFFGQCVNDKMDGLWIEYPMNIPGQKQTLIKTEYTYKKGILDGPSVATYTTYVKTTWYKNGVVTKTETKETSSGATKSNEIQEAPEMIRPVSETKPENDPDQVITYCENMPSYKGGEAAFSKYMSDSLRYPKAERDSMISGTVYVEFIVRKDGSITDVKVVRKVTGHPAFSDEAVRIISTMPKWNPGIYDGKPANVKLTQPVYFKIE